IVVLKGYLDRGVAHQPLHGDRLRMHYPTVLVEVPNERHDATVEVEGRLAIVTLVDKLDAQALGQVGHLAKALRQDVEVVVELGKYRRIREEGDRRAAPLVRPHLLDRPARGAS